LEMPIEKAWLRRRLRRKAQRIASSFVLKGPTVVARVDRERNRQQRHPRQWRWHRAVARIAGQHNDGESGIRKAMISKCQMEQTGRSNMHINCEPVRRAEAIQVRALSRESINKSAEHVPWVSTYNSFWDPKV
jgi:hypothetical protein